VGRCRNTSLAKAVKVRGSGMLEGVQSWGKVGWKLKSFDELVPSQGLEEGSVLP
jgi:hypothetical protein